MQGFIGENLQLQEGAEEIISWLRQERGMEVALATRNNAKCVDVLLERCFVGIRQDGQPSFEPILTRVFKSEVDVDKILGICEQWGLPPAAVLMVGDSLGECV